MQRLEQIANDEKVNISESAIKRIAEISEGSLRDAESFLEQIILSNDEEYIDTDQINTILGITDVKQIELLREAILTGNINQTIQLINTSVNNNTSIKQLHNSLILSFREYLINLANTSNVKDQIMHIAKCLKIFVNLDFSKSLNHASSIEIAAIEASMLRENENYISPEVAIKEPSINKSKIEPTETIEKSMDIDIETINTDNQDSNEANADLEMEKQQEIETISKQNQEIVSENIIKSEAWQLVIEKFAKIKGERFAIGALLRDCKEASIDNNNLYLSFASNSNQERFVGELEHGKIKLDLIESISQFLQIPRLNEIVYNDEGKKNNSNNNSVNLSVMKALNWGGKIIEEEVKNDE